MLFYNVDFFAQHLARYLLSVADTEKDAKNWNYVQNRKKFGSVISKNETLEALCLGFD